MTEDEECPICGASTRYNENHSCRRVLRYRREDENQVTADK